MFQGALKRWNHQSDDLWDLDFNNSVCWDQILTAAHSLPMPASWHDWPQWALFQDGLTSIIGSYSGFNSFYGKPSFRWFPFSTCCFFILVDCYFLFLKYFLALLGDPVRKPGRRFQDKTSWIIDLPHWSDYLKPPFLWDMSASELKPCGIPPARWSPDWPI